jgi:hypothetical protein
MGDNKMLVSDSVNFLKKILSLEDVIRDLKIQGNILVHLGNLSDKLSSGN